MLVSQLYLINLQKQIMLLLQTLLVIPETAKVVYALSKKKLIHAYGPMKKTVVMGIDETIKRIEKTAKLKVIGIKRL